MKRALFNYIADIIMDYPNFEKYISQREQALMYKYQEFKDENIGGGRAENKKDEGVANIAITIAEDKRLINLKRNYEAVQVCLEHSDSITRDIIYELYIRENCILTIDGIAQKTHLSRAVVARRRLKFFERVAKEIGL